MAPGMSKLERVAIGAGAGVACPLLTLIGAWWSAALLRVWGLGVPEWAIATAALAGLALGMVLDAVFLRRWMAAFYTGRLWFMGAVYLALSVIALASCMGVPLGTFLVGVTAGVYMGRRQRHTGRTGEAAARTLGQVALLAAGVTTTLAAAIGVLAWRDREARDLLAAVSGLEETALRGSAGLGLVALLCVVLFGAQYWFARQAGRVAYTLGSGRTGPARGA